MRIGLIAIYVDDQDQAERFYTEPWLPGQDQRRIGAERWLSLVSPEEPDGLELTLHLADEPARASKQPGARSGDQCSPAY